VSENYAVVAISWQQPRNLTAVVSKVAEHIMFFHEFVHQTISLFFGGLSHYHRTIVVHYTLRMYRLFTRHIYLHPSLTILKIGCFFSASQCSLHVCGT